MPPKGATKKVRPKKDLSANDKLVALRIDKHTDKRSTVFDLAKMKIHKDLLSKGNDAYYEDPSSGGTFKERVIKVPEDDLRLAIQEVHDNLIAQEYSKQDKLLKKVMEL